MLAKEGTIPKIKTVKKLIFSIFSMLTAIFNIKTQCVLTKMNPKIDRQMSELRQDKSHLIALQTRINKPVEAFNSNYPWLLEGGQLKNVKGSSLAPFLLYQKRLIFTLYLLFIKNNGKIRHSLF